MSEYLELKEKGLRKVLTLNSVKCLECGESVDSAVEIGEVGYDTEYVYACKECLTKALELI